MQSIPADYPSPPPTGQTNTPRTHAQQSYTVRPCITWLTYPPRLTLLLPRKHLPPLPFHQSVITLYSRIVGFRIRGKVYVEECCFKMFYPWLSYTCLLYCRRSRSVLVPQWEPSEVHSLPVELAPAKRQYTFRRTSAM